MAADTLAPQPTAEPDRTVPARVPLGLKLAYGSGNTVEGIVSACLSTFAFFYFTAVLGLSGTLAGAAMAISLVVDAFLDPMLGSVSDNTRTRWGRRHPMMVFALVPLVFTLGLMFTTPAGLPEPVLFVWLTVLAVIHRIALSGITIPHAAFGAELSNDYKERTSIVAVARLFSVVGTVIAVVLGYGVFLSAPGATLQASAYVPLGWTCALLALVVGVIFLVSTLRAGAQVMPAGTPDGGAALKRLPGEVREVLSNRSFRVLFAGLVLFFVAIGSHLALSLHANVFFWKLPGEQLLTPTLGYLLGIMVGIPATALLGIGLDKRSQVFVGLGMLCLSWTVLPLAHIFGFTGGEGGRVPLAALTANWMMAGIGSTIATIAYGSMMGDAADEHEHLFGVRREGLYFAGLSFASKTATGLGTLIAGIGLDAVGFPRGLDGQQLAQVEVADTTVQALGWVYGPGTALLTILSILILLGYRLTAQRHGEIVTALGSRRAG